MILLATVTSLQIIPFASIGSQAKICTFKITFDVSELLE
jgi:hypothetical protein